MRRSLLPFNEISSGRSGRWPAVSRKIVLSEKSGWDPNSFLEQATHDAETILLEQLVAFSG